MGRNRGTRLSILWIHLHPVQPRSPAVRKAALASSRLSAHAAVRALRRCGTFWRAFSRVVPPDLLWQFRLAGDREGVVVPAPVTALTQAMGHPAVLGLLRILGPAPAIG